MNKYTELFTKNLHYLLVEFIDQFIAAILLIIAFTAWVYFSSVYIAILVLIIGIILWSLLRKFLKGCINMVDIKNKKVK